MDTAVLGVLWLVFTIGAWVLYHKIFTVYYFDVSKGLFREFFGAMMVGLLLTGITLYLWWLTAIIFIITGLALAGKIENPSIKITVIVIFIIIAIIVSVVGCRLKLSTKESDKKEKTTENEIELEEDDLYSDKFTYDNSKYEQEEEMNFFASTQEDDFYSNKKEEDIKDSESFTEFQNENMEFVLPDSNCRYLNKDEIINLTAEECRIARNEIYARKGRKFKDEELQSYFEQFDWYSPFIEADDFKDTMLNEYELHNRDLIVEYEKEMGYR